MQIWHGYNQAQENHSVLNITNKYILYSYFLKYLMCQYCTAQNFDGGKYDELDEFLVIRQNFTI